MSTGGYGRGGRGAALMQALNAPARKPGQSPSGSPPHEEQAKQPTAPTIGGRGGSLASLLGQMSGQPGPAPVGRGMLLAKVAGSSGGDSPSQQAAPPPAMPMGRGLAGMSLGRGLRLGMAAPAPAPAQNGHAKGVNGHAQGMNGHTKGVNGHSSAGSVSTTPSPPPAPEEEDTTGKKKRLTSLEMMSKLALEDKPPVAKHGSFGEVVPVSVNYIAIRCRTTGVYQYHVSFSPMIDSKGMRHRFIKEHADTLGEGRAFDGTILFLPHKLPEEETTLQCVRPTDQVPVTVKIKLVKVLRPENCIQVYNVLFRRIMNVLQMVQVGRHNYDPHRPGRVPQHRLEVWPGYITSIQEYEGGLMLCTDVSHRVLRTETVLELMRTIVDRARGNFQEEVTKVLIGTTVLTRYNNRTYRIDDIDWSKNPAHTFENSKGESISFMEYYKKAYNKTITDEQQPLLIHRPKPREQSQCKLEMVCLIPELCYMTGLTDEMRADFRVMKDLATHTRVTPMQRKLSMQKFCQAVNSTPDAKKELSKWGLELDTDLLQIQGRQFPRENINFRNQSFMANEQADWGRELTRDRVINAVDIRSWMIVYTKKDEARTSEFVATLLKVAPQMGINVSPPMRVMANSDRTEAFTKSIMEKIHNQIQLVVTVFPTSRDDRYNAVKKLCCADMPVPSQVIISKTIGQQNKLRSVTQKIALQLNCKLGGELWSVDIPMKHLMVIGIDVYHDKMGNRSVGGFVASMNSTITRWYNRVCFQMPGQELIDGLKLCLTSALTKYHEVNHSLPEKIVVYRDGVGDGQLRYCSDYEVRQLQQCFMHFGEAYQPKMAVIVVSKRINTRIFARNGHGQLDNPPPGTIMDHTVTKRDWYNFYLVSQHVRQGTVSPTHYIVVYNDTSMKVDHVQRLTYKMTHLYYNWPGTVRVPAPCQYAHKLAYLVGQNIRKDPSLELGDRLFFL